MEKDKIIEEMAFDLIKATSPLGVKDLTEVFDYKKVATDLCNLWNWSKITEGSVVLSKEEYKNDFCSQFNKGYKIARKETAKEILRDIKYEIEDRNGAMLEEDLSVDATILQEVLNEIAEQYGVEE